MKKLLFIYLQATVFISSCHNPSGERTTKPGAGDRDTVNRIVAKTAASITPRDGSNAYSDLFLDSLAAGEFISQEKMSEEEAAAMRTGKTSKAMMRNWRQECLLHSS